MKYRVKVEGKIFDVEIEDLHTQPVLARVDGSTIEVWLEDANTEKKAASNSIKSAVNYISVNTASPAEQSSSTRISDANGNTANLDMNSVLAPIPGVIVSISAKVGDEVEPGQELCVLEAMKMKNVIRASRNGKIAAIHITIGQSVKHHDLLLDFSE